LLTVTRGTPGQEFTPGLANDLNLHSAAPGSQILTRSFYAPVAGDWYFDGGHFHGAFYYNSRTKMTDVSDGASNTLFFGEVAGGEVLFAGAPRPLLSVPSVGIGGAVLSRGPGEQTDYARRGSGYVRFGSRHPGLVQFAYGDGSVRKLTNIPYWNREGFQSLLGLGGIHDGMVISGDY